MRTFNIYNSDRELPKETQSLIAQAKAKRCSSEQEIVQLKALRNGDISAIALIINAKEFSIIEEAIRLQHEQISLSELIEAGKKSLETMLLKYADTDELFKQYVSFTGWWIKQGMEKHLKENHV